MANNIYSLEVIKAEKQLFGEPLFEIVDSLQSSWQYSPDVGTVLIDSASDLGRAFSAASGRDVSYEILTKQDEGSDWQDDIDKIRDIVSLAIGKLMVYLMERWDAEIPPNPNSDLVRHCSASSMKDYIKQVTSERAFCKVKLPELSGMAVETATIYTWTGQLVGTKEELRVLESLVKRALDPAFCRIAKTLADTRFFMRSVDVSVTSPKRVLTVGENYWVKVSLDVDVAVVTQDKRR